MILMGRRAPRMGPIIEIFYSLEILRCVHRMHDVVADEPLLSFNKYVMQDASILKSLPISHSDGQAMGCLLWGFLIISTVLYNSTLLYMKKMAVTFLFIDFCLHTSIAPVDTITHLVTWSSITTSFECKNSHHKDNTVLWSSFHVARWSLYLAPGSDTQDAGRCHFV